MGHQTSGILVLDERGDVRFAAGLGKDAALTGVLTDCWKHRGSAAPKRLFTLSSLERPLVVATNATAQGVCFLVFETDVGDELVEFIASVDFAHDILRHFITSPYEAVTVVDTTGRLRYMSPVHEKFFGLRHGEAVGQQAVEVIENSRLSEVAKGGKAQIGQVQEMNGVLRVVSRTPIFDRAKRRVGAIGQIMFKGPEAMQELSGELARVRQERDFYQRELSGIRNRSYGLDQIIGRSDAVRRLKEDIQRVAPLDVPVLLVGESGSGKELVAHALHLLSPRSDKPLVLVNSAAMPPNLVESELFGYEPGAFTGADRKGRKGKFEQADTGSLFLDEIGDMPLEMQVKLLRVLQDGTFERVGGDRNRHSDFRLISASHRDFEGMIGNGTFRLDLFYRISAVTLRLPPLRERLEDIPLLADSFLDAFARRHGTARKSLDTKALDYLQSRPWPGNIRQLQHAIERAAIFSDGEAITVGNLAGPDDDALEPRELHRPAPPSSAAPSSPSNVRAAKDQVELNLIVDAMERLKGNKKRVATELGVSRSYLYKRLREIDMA